VSDETGAIAARLGEVEERLGEIDSALGQLDDGTYGTCRSCGRAIPDDRLTADPAVRLCEACPPASGGGEASDGREASGGG
jgi:DnaK suppressor protein